MAESGTSFTIDLPVRGAEGVRSAADAMDALAQRLDVASRAADAANAAVSKQETAYRQAEASYNSTSKALERVSVAMQGASGPALTRLQEKHDAAAVAAMQAREAMQQEAVALDALKISAAGAQQQVDELTAAEKSAKDATAAHAKSQAESIQTSEVLSSSLAKIGGPLGSLGSKAFGLKNAWDKMGKTLGAGGPYVAAAAGIAVIATAVIAMGVAIVQGAISLGKWAVGLADARRHNELLAAGMVQSAQGGRELNAAVESLAARVPVGSDKLRTMASELAKAGLRGKDLTDKLEENAIAAAKLEFGPEWEREMLSLDRQQTRLKSGLASLFSGLKIEGLLKALSSLVDLFDENMASGKAIKVVFESIFQPAIDGAEGFIPKIRSAFIQFEILVLKALIAIKPWGSTILKVGQVIAVIAGVALAALAAALGVVIALIGTMVAVLVFPIALFAAIAAGVVWLGTKLYELGAAIVTFIGNALGKLGSLGLEIVNAIAKTDLFQAGWSLIEGLAKGITAGATAVVTAVTDAASGAVGAAKKALGIASPSKVFAEIGLNTAAGMEQGVSAGGGDVQASMVDMVAPPPALAGPPALALASSAPAQAPAAAPAAPAAASGSTTYQITINAPTGKGDDIAQALVEALTRITEGAAIQVGAGVPA